MRATRDEQQVPRSPRPVRVGVVGAGVMGAGIAQVALEAGDEVLLYDLDAGSVERAEARIRDGLTRRALKLGLDADSADDWADGRISRLRTVASLDAVGAEATLLIEAAIEELEAKRTIFRTLDGAANPDALLATNTSALSIEAIASATTRPARVVGLHFFNPAPLMALVEVVRTPITDPAVVETVVRHVERWGKTAVVCRDTPGFIVNRVNRPFTIEALRILEAELAGIEAIDAAMRDGGFPMGPFELIDLAGVDVNLAAARAIWEGLGRPEHLRPSPIQEDLVGAGTLGRKTDLGFYRYDGGRRGAVNPVIAGTAGSLPAAEIQSRIQEAIEAEAVRAVEAGVATPEDVDRALKLGAGHPIGPFERREATRAR